MKLFCRKYAVLWGTAAILIFISGIVISFLLFPGKYVFCKDFISALGMTVSPRKVPNPYGSVTFNLSLAAGMAIMLPFWYHRSRAITQRLQIISLISALGFAICASGVAFTPYNLFKKAHDTFAYSTLFFAVALFMLFFWGSKKYYKNKPFFYFFSISSFLIIILDCSIFLLASYNIIPKRISYALLQKLNVLFIVAWILFEVLYFKHKKNAEAGIPLRQ